MALKKEVRKTSAVRGRKASTPDKSGVKSTGVHKRLLCAHRLTLPRNWETHCLTLARDGASEAELRAALGISRTKFDQLLKESQPFALVMEYCRDLSQAWWERQGRENLQTKGFQTTLWNLNMKHRYGWGEQQNDPTSSAEAIAARVALFLDDLDMRVRPS